MFTIIRIKRLRELEAKEDLLNAANNPDDLTTILEKASGRIQKTDNGWRIYYCNNDLRTYEWIPEGEIKKRGRPIGSKNKQKGRK